MDRQKKKEEFLETLWHMRERGQNALALFKDLLREDFDAAVLDELVREGLVRQDSAAQTVEFTQTGENDGRRLVRAHRLAERLIHDVLGGESELSACEFEHTVNLQLVDGICTLLGHPRECPHGMPIPEGECCRRSTTSAESSVVPLTQLSVGQEARIAWVQCKNDEQMHTLEDMQLRPGAAVRLHQTKPTYVVWCEGATIALDRDVASAIRVWRPPQNTAPQEERRDSGGPCRRRRRRGWGMLPF